jgi:choline dehydrogenase
MAAAQVGIRHNPDYNGASQEGIAMSQATIAGGRRMSTAHCYLDPIRDRRNLHIETEALTEALVLDGKRCTGVRYSVAGEVREARAGCAVVVSAGAFNSPQLLELSGIGQPERLRNLGIEVRHELQGVGENLRDHYVPRTRWLVGKKGITFNDRGRGLSLVNQVLRYAVFRQGMLAMTGAPIRAFVYSREGLGSPDLMLGWIPMLTEPSPRGPRISRQSGLTLYAHAMRPESRGHVHIAAADARQPPAINFNFLSSPPDAELTVRAVRIARAIMTAPAMTPFQMTELAPGTDRTTDDEILAWVKAAAETTYHPVGTCKMGADPMAVVDSQLRVHGMAGLRVADASIMPTLTSGNTNAPSIMIGEKAADMLLNTPT